MTRKVSKKKTNAKKASKESVATPGKLALEERNGTKRPREGGKCAEVWAALDDVVSKGEQPTSKHLRELVEKRKWNQNNAGIEFSRWRRFNGISVRAA